MASKRKQDGDRTIYLVIDGEDGGKERLVDAGTASQAVRHCVRGRYTTTPATPHVIARLVAKGVPVEKAGKEPTPETETAGAQ
jgi:hypothetical protein